MSFPEGQHPGEGEGHEGEGLVTVRGKGQDTRWGGGVIGGDRRELFGEIGGSYWGR